MKVLMDTNILLDEDAVITATAIRESVDYIVTRNTSDFSSSAIPVIKPSDFLSILSENVVKG